MNIQPWFLLDPNDFQSKWWKTHEIFDYNKFETNKESKDILAHIIIQDQDFMGRNYWHLSSWYTNDPNRYNSIIFTLNWPFNKELTDMIPGDIIYSLEQPHIKFNVNYCVFGESEQQNFCKILERIYC